jgi:hypothetical protein
MKCHGTLNSSKISHLSGQTYLLEDIAVDTFVHSSFGTVVMTLLQGFFSTPSWRTFTYLACGWTFASDRHTITTYLWLTGASAVKHFSRFYVFLLYRTLCQAILKQVVKRLPHRVLSLERATNPEGVGDE